MNRLYLFLIFSIGIFTLSANAQKNNHILPDNATTDIVKKALDHTYNYEFQESKIYCDQIRKKYPLHPGPDFIMALNSYWEMMYNDNYKEKIPVFLGYLNKSLELSKSMLEKNDKDIEGVFFKLASECYITLFYSERNDLSTTLGYAKKMYGSMKTAFSMKAQLNEFYFPSGIYNYYVVMYPESHPIFKPFMFLFMKGTKEAGFKDLDYAWKNSIFCKMECGYHLSNIYIKYEGTPLKADEYTQALHERYPQNLFYSMRRAEVLMAKKEYKEAEKIAHELYKSNKKYFVGCACVLYGMLYEDFFKNAETSKIFYAKAVQLLKETQNPEIDYLSFAYAGLGRYYHQTGNKKLAIEQYEKCKEIAEYTRLMKESEAFLSKNK